MTSNANKNCLIIQYSYLAHSRQYAKEMQTNDGIGLFGFSMQANRLTYKGFTIFVRMVPLDICVINRIGYGLGGFLSFTQHMCPLKSETA